ncbi:SLOG family protein [Candidatus Soleaferrea massiliensis]|uniref:SLOG family protein n=1 Tax=Candidatus Soleaferrea massiliensis TaxID=1470354 RepID=UPI000590530A|nr:SLOG family protein [Candidatus Soleaferrea massiliensis]
MNEKVCCFTGHRELPDDQTDYIKKRLETEILVLAKQGVTCFLSGGALGFDLLAAQTVISLRRGHPKLRLILVLPCPQQAEYWNASDRQVYEDIKAQADWVHYVSQRYFKGCMHKRNRYLADHSGYCICYLTRLNSGTGYTVALCRTRNIPVVNLADSTK